MFIVSVKYFAILTEFVTMLVFDGVPGGTSGNLGRFQKEFFRI